MTRFIFFSLFVALSCYSLQAHPGIGIVMDSRGNIYYTDLTHVWKISPQGNLMKAVHDVHTHQLYLDENDFLYGEHEWYMGEAVDKWGNYTWVLSPEGKFSKLMEVEGFLENNRLVRDGTGNSYWLKRHDDFQLVYQQSMSGNNTLFSSHRFNNIRWMYFSKTDNHLYIVDHLEVKKIAQTGDVAVVSGAFKEETTPFAGVADHHYLFGLWTDTHGVIYVAVFGAGKIKKINPEGDISTFYESEAGWSPCGGLVAPQGISWILEFSEDNQTRVIRLSADGNRKVYIAKN